MGEMKRTDDEVVVAVVVGNETEERVGGEVVVGAHESVDAFDARKPSERVE